MALNRRAFLTAISTTIVGLAGCSGEKKNVIEDGTTIDLDPAELLPESSQLEDDWDFDEPSASSNRAENTYTLPSDSDLGLSKFDAYVSVSIVAYETVEEAEAEYDEDRDVAKRNLDTSSAGYADEAYFGNGADDTHLHFRENNLYVDLTEMEGNSDAKSHLKSFGDAIVENLEERGGS